ncbi:hypothetical protein C2E23DRAFT_862174 [Lenzites betulinus]|nr:hypothetical protein C2E23DRAFT_862174 [Lenzites betulinus]
MPRFASYSIDLTVRSWRSIEDARSQSEIKDAGSVIRGNLRNLSPDILAEQEIPSARRPSHCRSGNAQAKGWAASTGSHGVPRCCPRRAVLLTETLHRAHVMAGPFPLIRRLQISRGRMLHDYPFQPTEDKPQELDTSDQSTPPTAAAKFWDITDLRVALFEAATAEEPDQRTRAMLLNMALAGKSSFHLASAALWRSLNGVGLAPLMNILNGIRTEEIHWRSLTALIVTIKASREWRAFLYYASMVREINLHTTDIGMPLIPLLSSIMPDYSPLLPALRYIKWNAAAEPNDHLLYLLGPDVRRLQIVVPEFYGNSATETAFQEWTERLRARIHLLCPGIEEFGILTTPWYPLGSLLADYFDALHTIDVHMPANGGNDGAIGDVKLHISDFVKPLLQHARLLRRVELHLPNHAFDFNDQELLLLGQSWPDLVELNLTFHFFEDDLPPDIRCVGVLSHLCPYLAALELPALYVDRAADNLAIQALRHSPLASFGVGDIICPAYVGEAEVIQALGEAFPLLTPASIKRFPSKRLNLARV